MSSNSRKPVAAAIGAAFAGTVMISGAAGAAGNPFALTELNGGYAQLASHHGGGKCGAGKCGGAAKAKGAEGKCGVGKCGGAAMTKGAEGKCGVGKCGGAAKAKGAEGKCGVGKCGGSN